MAIYRPGWERFAPLGAFGFLLFIALGAAAVGESSPSGDAPAAEIAAYFAEHQGGHLLNMFLGAFGSFVLFHLFLASLGGRFAASRVRTACVLRLR